MALNFLRMTYLSFHIARNRSELSVFLLLIPIPVSQKGLLTILWMNNMLHLLKHRHCQ